MDLLRDAIDDSDMVVVQGGLMCLGQLGKQQLGGDEAVQLLVNVLTNENVALVYSATQALADINHPLVSSSLKSLMESSTCLLYTSPSPRDRQKSRMPSSA